jgi:hypothetical protein
LVAFFTVATALEPASFGIEVGFRSSMSGRSSRYLQTPQPLRSKILFVILLEIASKSEFRSS